MGLTETVIILSLYVYDGGNKNIEGWYQQDNLSTCLSAKRTAERNYSANVKYQCIKSKAETEIYLGEKSIKAIILE